MNQQDLNKMRVEIEKLAKKNSCDFSEGSNKSIELSGFINLKTASALNGVMCQTAEEISKIRRATFQFIVIEYSKANEMEKVFLQKYADCKAKLLEQTIENIEKAVISMISTFNEELGKTPLN